MIHARGLTKTFHRKKEVVEAVKGIDVEVAQGELVAFLGPNGAGKSTTLRMLTSLLAPTSGSAMVAGFDVVKDPAGVRSRIGYIGQGTGGGYSYRVRDELHNQGRFYAQPKAAYSARAAELMEALELTGLEKRSVQSLSGGQRRRLDVALGLMNHPPLLFLDEPTTGLDPQSRAHLWQLIQDLRDRLGMTLVLTTHYLEEADGMAERVVVIDHGQVIADASPAALKRDHADDVITLTASGASAESARAALSTLAAGGADITVEPAVGNSLRVRISTVRGADRLPEAIESLRSSGITTTAADLRRASLDDVFLNLTGRSLREEAV